MVVETGYQDKDLYLLVQQRFAQRQVCCRDDKGAAAVNEEQTKKKEQNHGSRETQNTAFGSPVVEVKMNHNRRMGALLTQTLMFCEPDEMKALLGRRTRQASA